MTTAQKLTSTILTFSRSIQTSEALFSAVRPSRDGEGREVVPVLVERKTVRGQISNYMKPGKKFNLEAANPQTIEYALVPADCTALRIGFSLNVLANALEPTATNDHSLVARFAELTRFYSARGGFHFLAKRYLWNIANARWIWRNRTVCGTMRVDVEVGRQTVRFDALALPLKAYPGIEALRAALVDTTSDALDALIDAFATALSDPARPLAAKVSFEGSILPLTEVFPSQEFARDDRGADKDVGRLLSSVPTRDGTRQASFHSQKIGAALRFVDEWHQGGALEGLAVSANPYAGVTELSLALRSPKSGPGGDFYSLLGKPDYVLSLLDGDTPFADDDVAAGDLHFVIANLIRGGVYGAKDGTKGE